MLQESRIQLQPARDGPLPNERHRRQSCSVFHQGLRRFQQRSLVRCFDIIVVLILSESMKTETSWCLFGIPTPFCMKRFSKPKWPITLSPKLSIFWTSAQMEG